MNHLCNYMYAYAFYVQNLYLTKVFSIVEHATDE